MSASAEHDPGAILTRLQALHPRLIDLSLDRVYRLLQRLGDPHRYLPPVVHVAGTNGKGSTVAFLRAMLAAHGRTTHVYTSPHLVRFNERIVVADRIIDDQALTTLLARCEAANDGAPITFFEITTVAALLAFAEMPADFTLLETGLGGRLDATNVVDRPALTVITPISIDHRTYLGETLGEIAFEKAGILKPGVACVVAAQPPAAAQVIASRAEAVGAPLVQEVHEWSVRASGDGMQWRADGIEDAWDLPAPVLPGAHQRQNGGVAITALHRLLGIAAERERVAAGLRSAVWPARLQHLARGSLAALLPADWELWLDGGHNPGAAEVLATQLRQWQDRPCYGVIGMLQTKDAAGFVAPLTPLFDTMVTVDIPDEPASFAAEALATLIRSCGAKALACDDIRGALAAIGRQRGRARVLICGSLYLAGHVLAANARG